MKNIWNQIYGFFISKHLIFMKMLPLVLLLSGCGNDDTSTGEEGNYSEQATCWQESIIDALTAALDLLYTKGAEIAVSGKAIILFGFSVWLALKMLKMLGSFKEENIGEVLTEITQKAFLCAVCFYFVANTAQINEALHNFLSPIYNTVIELGIQSVRTADENKETHSDKQDLGDFGETIYDHGIDVCPVDVKLDATLLRNTIRPVSNCLICHINDRLNAGTRISLKLIGMGSIGSILIGLFLLFVFFALKISFILSVTDSMFRMNFAGYFFAILILGIPFSYTRKWSKHGFLMFINSAGIMMFLALLVGLAVGSMEQMLNTYTANGAFTEGNILGIGAPLLSMFLFALILFQIPVLAVALADKFIGGGGGMEFQKKVSKFLVNLAKKAGMTLFNQVTGSAASQITKQLEKFEKTREAVDAIKKSKNAISDALNSLAGYNDNE